MHAESEEEILQELTQAVHRLSIARDAVDREVDVINTLTALLTARGDRSGTVTPPQDGNSETSRQVTTVEPTHRYLLGSHLKIGDRVRITNPTKDQPPTATVIGAGKKFIQLQAQGHPEIINRTPRKLIKLN